MLVVPKLGVWSLNIRMKIVLIFYNQNNFAVRKSSNASVRLAEEELLREAQRGASRAAVGGALAWQKCPLQPTNKRFLVNMIQYTLNANKLKEEYQLKKSETKKHHSGHSVQKVNSPQSPRHNRKRTRKDTCCVHDDGQKQETYKRKASKKRNS